MSFTLITNHSFQTNTGFTKTQFKNLDGLYLRAAASGVLTYRTVECDFEEEVACYTYYTSEHQPPYLQFLIRRAGLKTMMYELYKYGKGRIIKSGVFERAFERLECEIEGLLKYSNSH